MSEQQTYCGGCEIYRRDWLRQLGRATELEKIVESERAAVARFLVPYRNHLPESWLEHFEKECGVYFDEIGFVHPRPIPENLRGDCAEPANSKISHTADSQ